MPKSPSVLESLWAGLDLNNLVCSQCGNKIDLDDPNTGLARTFSLASSTPNTKPPSQRHYVRALDETITIYHRHLRCLFKSVEYVAISHVWHPGVADLQYRKGEASTSTSSVTQVVLETPVKVCLGLAKGIGRPYEIWHDYISVPQWQQQVKSRIIQQIPQIYGHAAATVAYLSDADFQDVESMRHGKTSEEISRAVSNLCNSKWFSRVWTAMEYTQSQTLRTMTKDFTLLQQPPGNTPLLVELRKTWDEQVSKRQVPWHNESMVNMGQNLVPWQLGPLEEVRKRNLQKLHIPFALAHGLLARRCLTIPRDFFHGFLGVLKIGLTESDLSQDTTVALSEVARRCIFHGDYSPLLMVPASSLRDLDDLSMRSHGYHDLVPFALGPQLAPPTFPKPRFETENPTLALESIGSVGFVERLRAHQSFVNTIPDHFKLIFSNGGSNMNAFAKTLTRLYRIPAEKVIQHLNKRTDGPEQFQILLNQINNSQLDRTEKLALAMAECTGLLQEDKDLPMSNRSPLAYFNGHGTTLYLEDASAIVGVDCHSCGERFLLRVSLFQNESQLLGAEAYRIPGLRYSFTLPGGAGFLVKDKRILGRFIWGVPTCDCNSIGQVEVVLADLPSPKPNTCQYGSGSEWEGFLPLQVRNRIDLS